MKEKKLAMKAKELDIKEKALAIKEKEIAMKEKKPKSWVWIILWLILFPPVLLILPFSDRRTFMETNRVKLLLPPGLLIIAGLFSSNTAFFCIVWIGTGVILLTMAIKALRDSVKFQRYVNIVNNGEHKFDSIATIISLPYKTVSKDLQTMINLKYFEDAYLDPNGGKIVLPQSDTQSPDVVESVIPCPSCGANNVVTVGKVGACEYCGTPLNG